MIYIGKGQVATLPDKGGKQGRIKHGEEISKSDVSETTFEYLLKKGDIVEGDVNSLRKENERLKAIVESNAEKSGGKESTSYLDEKPGKKGGKE